MISDFHRDEINFVMLWLMLDINKSEEHSTTEVLVYIFQTTTQTETEYYTTVIVNKVHKTKTV
jgi:hypothetical protein